MYKKFICSVISKMSVTMYTIDKRNDLLKIVKKKKFWRHIPAHISKMQLLSVIIDIWERITKQCDMILNLN